MTTGTGLRTRRIRRVTVGVGGAVVLVAALDAYVVVTLFVEIARDLGLGVNRLERATPLVTGFLLGYVAGMPLLGSLSDRYGRRPLIYACLIGFGIASVVTATGPTLPVVAGGRLLQGLAGGALLPVTLALVADLYPRARRATALGVVSATQELGVVLGPLYGAALAAVIGWRGLFWVNVPLVLVAGVVVHKLVPAGRPAGDGSGDGIGDGIGSGAEAGVEAGGGAGAGARRPVPVLGGGLLAVALGLAVVGLYQDKPFEALLAPWAVPVLVVAGLAAVAFFLHQRYGRHPLLDLTGVRVGPLLAGLAASALAGAAALITLVNIQVLAEARLGLGPLDGALLLVRFLAALPVGAVLGGLVARRYGERPVAVAGLLLATGAFLLVALWPAEPLVARYEFWLLSLPRFDVDLVLAGLGIGLVIAPQVAAVLRAVPPPSHGVASGLVVVARMVGMLLGVAALFTWGLYRLQELSEEHLARLVAEDGQAEFGTVAFLAQQAAAAQAALRDVHQEIFLATAGLCLLGAVVSLGLLGSAAAERPADPAQVRGRAEPPGAHTVWDTSA